MPNLWMVLIGLALLAHTSAETYFVYQGRYPITYFQDFKYTPTETGYMLWYKNVNGIVREEIGYEPGVSSRNSDSNPDTLGSSNEGRVRSKMMLKNRKVSPKLLASLSG